VAAPVEVKPELKFKIGAKRWAESKIKENEKQS